MIASLVFGACGLLAAAAVQWILKAVAEQAGVNPWIFVTVPGLFAMLFALLLFQDARKKIKRVGESVSRGILIALLSWLSFSALATGVWCPSQGIGECFSHILLVAAVFGGGPMLAAALIAGILTGILIIRPPSKGIE